MSVDRSRAGSARDHRRPRVRSRQIVDATDAGIALLTGVDAAAQRISLELGSAALASDAAFATAVHDHDASEITTGTVAPARLGSGSGGVTKFLREDSTWQAAGGGGGGSPPNYGTATIDFGAFPGSNEASVAVTGQAAILAATPVEVFMMADDTSGTHTAGDHRYAQMLLGLSSSTPTVAVGFTIHARCAEKMQGTFAVRWRWSAA